NHFGKNLTSKQLSHISGRAALPGMPVYSFGSCQRYCEMCINMHLRSMKHLWSGKKYLIRMQKNPFSSSIIHVQRKFQSTTPSWSAPQKSIPFHVILVGQISAPGIHFMNMHPKMLIKMPNWAATFILRTQHKTSFARQMPDLSLSKDLTITSSLIPPTVC